MNISESAVHLRQVSHISAEKTETKIKLIPLQAKDISHLLIALVVSSWFFVSPPVPPRFVVMPRQCLREWSLGFFLCAFGT